MTFKKYPVGIYRPRLKIIKGASPMFLWLSFCLLGLSYHAVIHAWPEPVSAAEVMPEIVSTFPDQFIDSWEMPDGKGGEPKTFTAIRTYYTRASSCHNPKGNKCLTANGEDTTEGRTVACPRTLKLGTRLTLSDEPDHIYTCTDRYARFLDGKRGLPTVDVFVEDQNAGTVPAHKTVTVTVIE